MGGYMQVLWPLGMTQAVEGGADWGVGVRAGLGGMWAESTHTDHFITLPVQTLYKRFNRFTS